MINVSSSAFWCCTVVVVYELHFHRQVGEVWSPLVVQQPSLIDNWWGDEVKVCNLLIHVESIYPYTVCTRKKMTHSRMNNTSLTLKWFQNVLSPDIVNLLLLSFRKQVMLELRMQHSDMLYPHVCCLFIWVKPSTKPYCCVSLWLDPILFNTWLGDVVFVVPCSHCAKTPTVYTGSTITTCPDRKDSTWGFMVAGYHRLVLFALVYMSKTYCPRFVIHWLFPSPLRHTRRPQEVGRQHAVLGQWCNARSWGGWGTTT